MFGAGSRLWATVDRSVPSIMDHKQSINVKFCFQLHKSAKETHEILKLIYGDDAVSM